MVLAAPLILPDRLRVAVSSSIHEGGGAIPAAEIYGGALCDKELDQLHTSWGSMALARFHIDESGITQAICRVNIRPELKKTLHLLDISIAGCASDTGR